MKQQKEKEMNKNTNSIGVIVGRFQVPYLTDGHKEILDYVLSKGHEKNILFLGVPPTDVRCTKKNPIPYTARKQMIEEAYPNKFIILYIKDVATDEAWSKSLDNNILDITEGDRDIIMYGCRDSFISHYCGQFPCEEYHQRLLVSGTEIRESAAKTGDCSEGFRLGCVYSTQRSWTNFFPTVDCAIADSKNLDRFYMAKKAGQKLLRFVGGFWDISDKRVEDAALREAKEETCLDCELHSYIGSTVIDDWRYAQEHEKIMTTFYLLVKKGGVPKASDDIAELHIKSLAEISEQDVVKEHRPLLKMLKEHVRKLTHEKREEDSYARSVVLNQGNFNAPRNC